jgi:epoxyqueuosine reductase QueG
MLKVKLPQVVLSLLVATLTMTLLTATATAPLVFQLAGQVPYDQQRENQKEHASIAREIDKLGARIDVAAEYNAQMQQANLRNRMTVVETNLAMMMQVMWATLAGVGTLIVNAIVIFIQSKQSRQGKRVGA